MSETMSRIEKKLGLSGEVLNASEPKTMGIEHRMGLKEGGSARMMQPKMQVSTPKVEVMKKGGKCKMAMGGVGKHRLEQY